MALRTGLYLLLDALLFAFAISHASSLLSRARAPLDVHGGPGEIRVSSLLDPASAPNIRPGDVIDSWNGMTLPDPAVLEFLTDFERVGHVVTVRLSRDGTPFFASVTMIPYYTVTYVLMVFLIGFTSWVVGIYVLLKRPGQIEATVLHWGMMCLGAVVILAWEGTTPGDGFYYLSSVLFFSSYVGVAATFFLFTSVFPRRRPGPLWPLGLLIYALSALSLWPVLYYHSRAVFLHSVDDYLTFRFWFDVFHAVLFLFIAGAIVNFIVSFLHAETTEERKKTRWLVFGFCSGPTPFILLTLTPMLVAPEWTVPEKYTLAFLIIIPITFAISLVKHHLFDVDVVIQRTTVYGIVVVTLLALYVAIVAGLALIVGSYATETYAIAAVLVGLLFEPARQRVQHLVDRSFFRVRYNFREAERAYVDEIKRCFDVRELAGLLVNRTDELIPVEKIGLFVLHQPGDRLRTVAQKGFEMFERRSVRLETEKLATGLDRPVALTDRLEPGIDHEPADQRVFTRWGMALVFPMLSKDQEFLGFLVLGNRKAGTRFSVEDVDLLRNVATQAGLTLERIELQKKLILKEAEAERLAALNELKSDFVSYVSHELRTPLTSIKLFAELLREPKRGLDRKGKQFLGTIEGESDRLNRMVSTILDSAEIEHGVKEFNKRGTELNQIAARAVRTMAYQLKKNGFEVHAAIPRRPVHIIADPDAVLQAILNLMANAIKYSAENRYLSVTVSRRKGRPVCIIGDRGIGIPEETQARVFERFSRGSARRSGKEGVGLGLSLVKHIMEAHNGKVELESTPGRGSTFTLIFPQNGEQEHEANPDH